MPGEILYQLYRYRPQVRVHIASSKAVLCERINQKPTSAPHLSCIRSIEAEWCDAEYDEPIRPNSAAHYPAQLKDIIRRCENLESLALVSRRKYRVNPGEVSPYMERKELEACKDKRALITLEEGDNLPRIKNLHFHSMRFGPVQSELWATQLQWQNIKRLSLIEVDWTLLLPKLTKEGCFHALETLEASLPIQNSFHKNHPTNLECTKQLHAFLGKIPPLKMFIGYGLPQETLSVLSAYHSKSLKDLRFRNKNSYKGVPHFRASIDDLDNLSTQFPNLQSLGLQVNWTSDEQLVSTPDYPPTSNDTQFANVDIAI